MSMSREIWNKNLQGFKSSTTASKNYAKVCSEAALEHFAEHGDVVYLQEFLDAIPTNYGRKAAFLQWAKDFSPLAMKDGKLVKDKSDKANPFDLPGAMSEPFWHHSPDTAIGAVFFTEDDVVKSLSRALKRLEAKKPKTETAKIELYKAKALVASLDPHPTEPVNDPSQEAGEDELDNTQPETAEEAAAILAPNSIPADEAVSQRAAG